MSRRTSYMEYYAATSEAFALDAAPVWEPEYPARRAKPARPARRKKIVYTRVRSNERFFSFNMIVTLLLIFAGMVLCTMSFAAVKRSQLEISGMHTQLMQAQEEEATLRAKIAREYDVTQIEKTATMRLNMSKPKAYQIVYINAPRQDYVVQYGNKTEESLGSLEKVLRFINNL